MFESENWFIVFVIQNYIKAELFNLVNELLVVITLKRYQGTFYFIDEFGLLTLG